MLSSNGNKRRREATKGYQINLQWRDGSTTWSKLKDAKDSFPVEVAEFAVENGIADEPACAIKKKSSIVARIKSKCWIRMRRYGIQLPKSIEEAL